MPSAKTEITEIATGLAITGAPVDGTLSRLVNRRDRPVTPPPGGLVLSSDISFTMRDDKTVDMAQKDGSYNAVLKRCPRVE